MAIIDMKGSSFSILGDIRGSIEINGLYKSGELAGI